MKKILLADAIILGRPYAKGTTLEVATEDVIETGYKLAAREKLRGVIREEIADPESMLGVTADGTLLALIGISRLATSLAKAKTIADVRAAADDLAKLAEPFLTALDAGQLETTLEVKPQTNGEILNDVIGMNVGVAKIIKSAAEKTD